MKCTNCGSQLNIEDATCSYCGNKNPYFEKHRADMFRFQKDFEETRNQVIKKSGHFAGISVKISIIAILVAVDLLLIFFAANAWSFMNTAAKRDAERKSGLHREKLEMYEAQRNYIELANYYEEHSLYGSEALEDFEAVYRVCSNYSYIYRYIVEFGKQDSYHTDEDRLKYVSDNLEYLYQEMEPGEYDLIECYEGAHGELLEQMKYDLKVLFMTYANITEEEAEKFPTMSEGRRQVALEKGLGLYED